MNLLFKLVVISLLLAGLASCSTNPEEKVSKWPYAVNYEIFVRSFCDSDGDGIGDFKGMTSRLDHLSDLGVEGIWLMPVHPSSSYHKYNVSDYYDVHPDYGTLDDFREFISESRKRNIKVVIDMVINHSGNDLVWFTDAVENGKDSPFWDYYIWAHSDTLQSYIDEKAAKFPEYGRRNRWNNLRGTDYYYYSYFGRSMPQLNYDNPEVREEVFRIGRFWLIDIGVDGFRLDAARHVYPEDRAGDIHEWWEEYREEMVKAKEDVYLLGEVWAPAEEVAPYLKGLPALFNFDLSESIQNAVKEEKAGSLISDLIVTLSYYRSVNPDFIDATFITNHDQNRIMSVVEGDQNKARMAAALLFTLPGSPYVYYGEEIGMLGIKPDPNIREAFLWDTEIRDECRTAWRAPSHNTDDTVVPLAYQKEDENSLYNFYREFIKLRNYSKALTFGDIKAVDHDSDQLVAFTREHEKESLLVIHNISGSSAIFNLEKGYARYRKMKLAGIGYTRQSNKLNIPAYSTVILSR